MKMTLFSLFFLNLGLSQAHAEKNYHYIFYVYGNDGNAQSFGYIPYIDANVLLGTHHWGSKLTLFLSANVLEIFNDESDSAASF